jgi:protocatechuate 3,4-dioxygenase beta subunit
MLAALVPPRVLFAQDALLRVQELDTALRLDQQNGGQPVRATPAPRVIAVGTASISGVVVASDTGRPVSNALVSLQGTAGPPRGDGNGGAIPKPAVWPPLANDNIPVSRTTSTNAQGRFVFDKLAAGRYSVSTSRDGYLAGGWGQKRIGGQAGTLLLAEGQRLTMSIPLAHGGVITGQVLDEEGEPARAVQVQAWRSMIANGSRQFRQINTVMTDDRGMYRLFGLEPGDYRVAAIPRNTVPAAALRGGSDTAAIEAAIAGGSVKAGAALGYPSYVTLPPSAGAGVPQSTFVPVYAPSTTVPAEATTIRVEANAEQGPFTIHLQYVPTASIRGIVAPVTPGMQVRVALMSLDGGSNASTSSANQTTGEFTLRNVTPGRYRLMAQSMAVRPVSAGNGGVVVLADTGSASQPSMWGIEDVQVQGQDLDVALALRPSRTISGMVVSEATAANRQAPKQATLTIAPGGMPNVLNGTSQAPIDADGHFTFANVAPGSYTLRVPGLLKSSIVEGEDSLDFPFEFTGDRDITDAVVTLLDESKRTDLWGVVTDSSGKAVADVTVVVAPIDDRYWRANARRIVTMRSDPWGRVQTRTLPPGTYVAAMVDDLENGGQFDPDVLRDVLARGARVTLTESSATRQDFRVR